MKRKEFVLNTRYGIHLRPAVRIYQSIKDLKSKVQIRKKGESFVVDARSTLGIILLNIMPGDTIEIIADGIDENIAIQRLTELIEINGLFEDQDF